MLYVFLVNNGSMITFDMNLALDTVEKLKLTIFERHQIPIESQVLFISGGESLNPNDRVCKYSSAGTDTSPIFLFSKNHFCISSVDSYSSEIVLGEDMKERVESCFQMEPNVNTVASRTEMAIQLCETDNLIYHTCEKLVLDQHLQQQGWAAVVANLEDIVESFKIKAKKLEMLFYDILKNKSFYLQLLESFEEDKKILSKIPILKGLYPKNESYNTLTLLQWILQKDNENSLDELYCYEELQQCDQESLDSLKQEIEATLKSCYNSDMKEIKGLDNRLHLLDKYMHEAKKFFEKQNILMKGFSQNQTRLSDCKDPSILPDLCQNHKEQLQSMLDIHCNLKDCRDKCFKAKKELCENIFIRLREVVRVEEQLKQNDDKLVIFGIRLQKLRNKLEVIQNLHITPRVYLDTIVEVLRRKTFSEKFFNWANYVSQKAIQIVESETQLRGLFTAQIENHFLKFFFPGMNDYPQNFISDLVQIDQSLPQISYEDIEQLKSELPEFSNRLVVPSIVPIPLIGVDNNASMEIEESEPPTETKTNRDNAMGTSLTVKDINSLQSERFDLEKCLEEKNQLIDELVNKLNSVEVTNKNQAKTIEDYLKLNKRIVELFSFIKDQFGLQFKDQVLNYSDVLARNITNINCNLDLYCSKIEEQIVHLNNEISQKDNLNTSLQEKLDSTNVVLKERIEENSKLVEGKRETEEMLFIAKNEIQTLKSNVAHLNENNKKILTKLKNLCEELTKVKKDCETHKTSFGFTLKNFQQIELKSFEDSVFQIIEQINEGHIENLNSTKSKLIEENNDQMQKLREELSQEHKSELDSLRHRFKLAISTTSIERTSSETSLEKVQLDIVDQSAFEKENLKLRAQINELKSEYEANLSRAQSEYENQISNLKMEFECQKRLAFNDSFRKFLQENELNAEQIAQRLPIHETFFSKLSSTLANDVDACDPTQCKEILNTISKDLNDATRSLEQLNFRSFISIPYASESPKLSTESDSLSELNSLEPIEDKITYNSCEIGDTVLVYYKHSLNKYIALTTRENLHFIHSDSLKDCDIERDTTTDEYPGIIAKITEKEYCQIKKEDNRYNLPVNTKFYRLKVRQISKCSPNRVRQLLQSSQMNRSYLPSSSSTGTIFSSILSYLGNSTQMSQSYNFDSS